MNGLGMYFCMYFLCTWVKNGINLFPDVTNERIFVLQLNDWLIIECFYD